MNIRFTALTILFYVLGSSPLSAQEKSSSSNTPSSSPRAHESLTGPNGGVQQTVGSLQIETVLRENGIMFVIVDNNGLAVQSPNANGSMKLRVGDKPKEYTIKLQALKQGGIGAAIDLTKLKDKKLHMDVVLNGIQDETIEFHSMGILADTLSDSMLISLQKTCPITGKPLGTVGKPPKIMVKGKPLFVCCEPCSAKIKANPDEYLAMYYSAKGKEIRPGVYESTLADASAIAAQETCPVMDKKLGGMGVPQKVNVNGKSVYICCAGCAKKLDAQPEKYLAMLSKQGVNPPDFN
ncbi:MAG: hypothetical protein ACE361_25895 [Aureliella sp.]